MTGFSVSDENTSTECVDFRKYFGSKASRLFSSTKSSRFVSERSNATQVRALHVHYSTRTRNACRIRIRIGRAMEHLMLSLTRISAGSCESPE